jgi:YHS domain-containing protein
MHRRTLLSLLAAIPLASTAMAGEPEIFTGLVTGVAAGGYDTVSYFKGDPMEGKADFAVDWKGASWHFANAENMKAFQASPEKYAPQYGGYCAYAVSKGATAKGDPKAWTVVNNKLYLNYSEGIRDKWRSDIPGNITAANANWPKVLQ